MANFTGNSTKSLRTSVDASLKKLQTSYIDLVSLIYALSTTRPVCSFSGAIFTSLLGR